MKKTLFSVVSSLALTSSLSAADSHTWVTFGGSEYALSYEPVSVSGGRAEALSVGAHLATISSLPENVFVAGLLPTDNLWIGFTDEVSEGTFAWMNAEPVTYTNWALFEPNDADGEDYTVTNWGIFGEWNDLPDREDLVRYAVLERELIGGGEPVPEVQTYATLLGAALIGVQALRRKRA